MERLLGSRARKSEQSSTSAQAQQRTPTPTQHTHTKNISTLTAKEEKANAVQRHPHQARPDHVRHAAWQQPRAGADGAPAEFGPTRHCLFYTSDAADERPRVDPGGRQALNTEKL